jgi:16S rRNA processing protein RimM
MRRKNPVPSEQPEKDPMSGSPTPGEPLFLAVGKLRRSHGIGGEILMDVLTDFPQRLRVGKTVFLGDEHAPYEISNVRSQDRALLMSFVGINDSDEASLLRNKIVYIQADSLPILPEGEYYHHQLLGMAVLDENHTPLGFLTDILETGANDVYVVTDPDGKETLLPAIESVILEIDLQRREMRVKNLDWL